jgi:Holliday junction resolvase
MGRKSREKGKRGELELAAELRRLFGIEARRGVQYCGGGDSPDVVAGTQRGDVMNFANGEWTDAKQK